MEKREKVLIRMASCIEGGQGSLIPYGQWEEECLNLQVYNHASVSMCTRLSSDFCYSV